MTGIQQTRNNKQEKEVQIIIMYIELFTVQLQIYIIISIYVSIYLHGIYVTLSLYIQC